MSPARMALALALVAAGGFVASRIVASSGDSAVDAGASPSETLARRPLAGEAFAVMARAETRPARKLELHLIAARRAPRDLEVRAWLVEHFLASRQYDAALEQLDVILRLATGEMRKALLPAVVQLAADPGFSEALVDALATGPSWRGGVLAAMRGEIDTPGSTQVFAELMRRGELTEVEAGDWVNALIRGNHWGQAYSLWVSGLDLAEGESLPMLWDGGFEEDPDLSGFGWRVASSPGSYAQFESAAAVKGRAARLVFMGRPIETANLEQPLHLPAGSYRLQMRLRGEALRSDQGLRWEVACSTGTQRYLGEPLNGTFDWRPYTMDFNVPVTDCPGQWLRLRNPAPKGSAQIVSGELWVDDVTLDRPNNPE